MENLVQMSNRCRYTISSAETLEYPQTPYPFYLDINIIRSPVLHHKLKTCSCGSLFHLSFRCPDDAETLILSCAPHTAHNLPSREVVYDLGDIFRDSSECLAKSDVICNFSFTAGMSHLLKLVLITTRHPSVGSYSVQNLAW